VHATRLRVTSCQQLPGPSRRAAAGGGPCARADRPPGSPCIRKIAYGARHDKGHPCGEARLFNALGIRRDEKPRRRGRILRRRNEPMSVAGREAFDWLLATLKGLRNPVTKNPVRVVVTDREYRALLIYCAGVGWRFQVALVLAHDTGHRSRLSAVQDSGAPVRPVDGSFLGPISGRDDLTLHRREPGGRGGPAAGSTQRPTHSASRRAVADCQSSRRLSLIDGRPRALGAA